MSTSPASTDSATGATTPTSGLSTGGTTGGSSPPPTPTSPPSPTNQPTGSPTGQPSGSPSNTGTPGTSPSSGSSTAAPPAPVTGSPSIQTVSTTVETTFVTTNTQGKTTTILSSTQLATTTVVSSGQSKGLSGGARTGAIVGGVLGGIAVLALLALALWWCMARRRKRDQFDGNFDPDNVGGGPSATVPDVGPVDLVDGPAATPYTYGSDTGMSYAGEPVSSHYSTSHAGTSEYQYPQGGMMPSPHDNYGGNSSMLSPGAAAAASGAGGAAAAYAAGHDSQPAGAGGFRSAKEREAIRPHVANPDGVIVHQDAGRYREDEGDAQPAREIPPTYNSISEDDERR